MLNLYKHFNLKINGAPSNNTAPANSSDKIFKNFIIEINNTAQYYLRNTVLDLQNPTVPTM